MMVKPVSFLALGFLSRDSHPQTDAGGSMAFYCRCSTLWLLFSPFLYSASFIAFFKKWKGGKWRRWTGVREKRESRKKFPAICLARSPARWWGGYFGIMILSLRLSSLQLKQGWATGRGKSITKNNHPLDTLAIAPGLVNNHYLWLTELWALMAGSLPADVISEPHFLPPVLLKAWPKALPGWFLVYARK